MSYAAVFRHLATLYGWTFQQIADMTPAQVELAIDKDAGGGTRQFESEAEYRAWLRQRQLKES